jgi:hypothetical protein
MIFQNCKFDNGLLEIDTNDRVTENGFEVDSEKKRTDKRREQYRDMLKNKVGENS